jgi:hypothetical protein
MDGRCLLFVVFFVVIIAFVGCLDMYLATRTRGGAVPLVRPPPPYLKKGTDAEESCAGAAVAPGRDGGGAPAAAAGPALASW